MSVPPAIPSVEEARDALADLFYAAQWFAAGPARGGAVTHTIVVDDEPVRALVVALGFDIEPDEPVMNVLSRACTGEPRR